MKDSTSLNIRRPAEYEALLDKCLRTNNGAFKTYRDAMIFAAAVGWRYGRKGKLTGQTSPQVIELSTMSRHFGAEDLIDLIAFCDTEDPEILSPDRMSERIRIFEDYACGGLEIIDEMIRKEALTIPEVVMRLTAHEIDAIKAPSGDESDGLDLRAIGLALGL